MCHLNCTLSPSVCPLVTWTITTPGTAFSVEVQTTITQHLTFGHQCTLTEWKQKLINLNETLLCCSTHLLLQKLTRRVALTWILIGSVMASTKFPGHVQWIHSPTVCDWAFYDQLTDKKPQLNWFYMNRYLKTAHTLSGDLWKDTIYNTINKTQQFVWW